MSENAAYATNPFFKSHVSDVYQLSSSRENTVELHLYRPVV